MTRSAARLRRQRAGGDLHGPRRGLVELEGDPDPLSGLAPSSRTARETHLLERSRTAFHLPVMSDLEGLERALSIVHDRGRPVRSSCPRRATCGIVPGLDRGFRPWQIPGTRGPLEGDGSEVSR